MSIEIFDDDIEQLRDDLSVEPWNVISNDDVRNSCLLPIRISYEFVDMGDTEYEPTLKSKACLKCLYFTKIISALCCYLEYFSYLYTIN